MSTTELPNEQPLGETVESPAETPAETPSETQPSREADFSSLPKEFLPLLERARAQEKQKLYKERQAMKTEISELRHKIGDLETAAENAPPKKKREQQDEADELKNMVRNLQDQIRQADVRAQEQARRTELRQYRTDRISNIRSEGQNLVESLVSGNTEEEIDASLEVARAEYSVIQAEVERRLTAAKPKQQVVVHAGQKPAGVAPTMSTGAPASSGTSLSIDSIKELTSIEAIRDGRYAKHRAEILAAIRQGRVTSNSI